MRAKQGETDVDLEAPRLMGERWQRQDTKEGRASLRAAKGGCPSG